MPSLFPELLNYSQIAPLILRFFLAFSLLFAGSLAFLKPVKIIQIICAICLVAGLFTQPVAIVVFLTILTEVIVLKTKKMEISQKNLRLMIAVIALSLAFSGPGLYALDLPL